MIGYQDDTFGAEEPRMGFGARLYQPQSSSPGSSETKANRWPAIVKHQACHPGLRRGQPHRLLQLD